MAESTGDIPGVNDRTIQIVEEARRHSPGRPRNPTAPGRDIPAVPGASRPDIAFPHSGDPEGILVAAEDELLAPA